MSAEHTVVGTDTLISPSARSGTAEKSGQLGVPRKAASSRKMTRRQLRAGAACQLRIDGRQMMGSCQQRARQRPVN